MKLGDTSSSVAPTVREVIGLSLPYIGSFKQMDTKKQVVALIDDVSILIIHLWTLILSYKYNLLQ